MVPFTLEHIYFLYCRFTYTVAYHYNLEILTDTNMLAKHCNQHNLQPDKLHHNHWLSQLLL